MEKREIIFRSIWPILRMNREEIQSKEEIDENLQPNVREKKVMMCWEFFSGQVFGEFSVSNLSEAPYQNGNLWPLS